MSKRNPRLLVKLWCGHYAYWSQSAVHNDARPCPVCRSVEACEDYWPTEWACLCSMCPYARYTGHDEGAAVELSRRHPHPCDVVKAPTEPEFRPSRSLQPDAEQGMLDLFPVADDPPPF